MRRMPKLINQPFEQTFRLQVNLPRNQRMVLRVSPRMTLAELKLQICNERELEYENHNLVHPAQTNVALDLNGTLGNYGCAEISIISKSAPDSTYTPSSYSLMICSHTDDEKRKRGILRLFSRKKKEITTDINSGSYNRFVLSEKNADNYENNHSKHSTKRKPAPAPPVQDPSSVVIQSPSLITSKPVAKFDELRSIISHSRHSSDSSGYHEPSVFSDCSENKSPEVPIVHHDNMLSNNYNFFCEDVSTNLELKRHLDISTSYRTIPSCSSIPNSTISKKRKAPLPPTSVLPDPETPSPIDKSMKNILVIAEVTSDELCKHKISSDQFQHCEIDQNEEIVCCMDPAALVEKDFFIADKDTESLFFQDASKDTSDIQYLNKTVKQSEAHEDLNPFKEQKSTCSNLQTKVCKSSTELSNSKENNPCLKTSSNGVCTKIPQNFDGLQEVQKSGENGKSVPHSDCSSNAMADESCSLAEPPTSSISAQCKLVNIDFVHDSKGKTVEEIPVSCESSMKVDDTVYPSVTSVALDNVSDIDAVMCIQDKNNVKMKKKPNVRIVPFADRNLSEQNSYGIKIGNVQKKCNELSGISIFPLTGRSTSLYSLTKKNSKEASYMSSYASEPSIDSFEQNFSKDLSNQHTENLKFKISPENFHLEYSKLQEKFLSWQKQLENNQSLLQNEIIPKISQLKISEHTSSESFDSSQKSIEGDPVKDVSKYLSQQEIKHLTSDDQKLPLLSSSLVSPTTSNSENFVQHITDNEILTDMNEYSAENVCAFNKSDSSKSQTLPRSNSQVTCSFKNSQTMTLNRKMNHKSHAVSVSIGSWLQRNEPADDIDSMSVASSRSKFQSLENIPLKHKMLSSICHESETSISGIPIIDPARKNKVSSLHIPSKISTVKLNEKIENAESIIKPAKKLVYKNEKKQVDCEGLKYLKSTKPFVRISSMKDEMVPPPLHTLKKWPFPEIHENLLSAGKQTAQEILKSTTIWSSLEPREKIVRAEVNLRKPKIGKPQILNKSTSTNKNSDIGTNIQNMHVKKTEKCDLDKCKNFLNEVSQQSNIISEVVLKKVSSDTIEEANKEPTYEEANLNKNKLDLFVNGSYLPPPPPPVSTMPAIPLAAAIPKSSLLIKDNNKTQTITTKSQKFISKPGKDPREELMLEIRGFGGKEALRKVISPTSSWHMKIPGSISALNL